MFIHFVWFSLHRPPWGFVHFFVRPTRELLSGQQSKNGAMLTVWARLLAVEPGCRKLETKWQWHGAAQSKVHSWTSAKRSWQLSGESPRESKEAIGKMWI